MVGVRRGQVRREIVHKLHNESLRVRLADGAQIGNILVRNRVLNKDAVRFESRHVQRGQDSAAVLSRLWGRNHAGFGHAAHLQGVQRLDHAVLPRPARKRLGQHPRSRPVVLAPAVDQMHVQCIRFTARQMLAVERMLTCKRQPPIAHMPCLCHSCLRQSQRLRGVSAQRVHGYSASVQGIGLGRPDQPPTRLLQSVSQVGNRLEGRRARLIQCTCCQHGSAASHPARAMHAGHILRHL